MHAEHLKMKYLTTLDEFHDAISAQLSRNQIPVRESDDAVRGGGGIGRVRAEPREDDRDATANRFAVDVVALLAHEQDRAFAVGLEERDMGAVLVNGGIGLRAGHGDAGEIAGASVEFQNVRQVELSVHWEYHTEPPAGCNCPAEMVGSSVTSQLHGRIDLV